MPLTFTRPYLYDKQLEAIFCPERWSYIEASTKSGKTVGCIAWLIEQAFLGQENQNFWWVAPVFPQADIAFRRIKSSLTKGSFTAFTTPQPRVVLINGASIWIKSADNPDSLYGEDVYAAVMDEASRAKEEAHHALRSTLTATRGKCRYIGNVKGRKNWFYHLSRRAEKHELPDAHYARITATDAVAAGVLDAEEIEDARRTLPEFVFKELYMAEAADDGGNPFGYEHINSCVIPELSSNQPFCWGIDLAKKQDYFVCIALDEFGQVCRFFRWQYLPWRESIKRVWQLVGEDTPALVDSTGVGDPVLEELQNEHGNFVGFNFSLPSKQKLMEGLAVSIQGHEISFPDGPIRQELDSFEYVYNQSGIVRYSAPEGYNDDCVCALALARQMWAERHPAQNIIAFMQGEVRKGKELNLHSNEWEEIKDSLPGIAQRRLEAQRPEIDVDNELTDFYLKTLNQQTISFSLCAQCHQAVSGPTRITDGEFVWHPECIRKAA